METRNEAKEEIKEMNQAVVDQANEEVEVKDIEEDDKEEEEETKEIKSLSDERAKLRTLKLFNAKGEFVTNRIIDKIEEQDKEFIRLLKEGIFNAWTYTDVDREEVIDKLAGPDLI